MQLRDLKKAILTPDGRQEKILGGLLRGMKLHLSPDSYFQRKFGLDERELHFWFRKLCRGIQTAIDIGAAEGVYTLFFLQKTKADRILAFEPLEDAIMKMKRNLELNGLLNSSRLEINQMFLDSSGSTTLDSFISQVRTPCLIKMDVERNEYNILKGSQKLLVLKDIRWIIELHTPELAVECRAILEKNGYRTKMIGPAWWRRFLPELRGEYVQWMVATNSFKI